MSKIVLSEYLNPLDARPSVVMEDSVDATGTKTKQLHMKGIFVQGDVRNANQRVYPVSEIRRAVGELNKVIAEHGGVSGECDHPDDLKINLDRVSHVITEMSMEGSNGVGKLKILPTPMGLIIKTLLENGVKLGVSSRGSGNVDEHTGQVSEFEIVTVDVVSQPSAPAAYPRAVYEGIMNRRYGHKTIETAKDALVDARVQKYLKQEIFQVIKDLKL